LKSQVSIEYISGIIILSAILFITLFTGYFSIFGSYKIKQEHEIENLADKITLEVELASYAGEGYKREIFLPLTVSGMEFNATINNYTLRIIFSNGQTYEKELDVEKVNGIFLPGKNLIENRGGLIYVS